MRVTAVIVTWNSARYLPQALASLDTALEGLTWQLVVADNASSDGSAELVSRVRPDATVVQVGRNAGYAAGLNAGMRATPEADAFLLLNPDIELGPGCGLVLTQALTEPRVGIAVPRQQGPEGSLHYSLRREPSVLRALGEAVLGGHRAGRFPLLGEVVVGAEHYARPERADWATGSALMVSAECVDQVGEWDESYFLYSEETDFFLRARDAGYVVRYCPDAVVVHVRGESHESPRLYSLLTMNRVRLFRRRNSAARTAAFYAATVLNELLRVRRPANRAALRTLLMPSARRELVPWTA